MKPPFLKKLHRRVTTLRMTAGQVSAVALAVIALLLVPQGAQAAVSVVNSVITDPVNTARQARVDANGNLQVTTRFQPVQAQGFAQYVNTFNTTLDFYTVPAGKRLVIQYVEGTVNYPADFPRPPLLEIRTTTGGGERGWRVETQNPAGAAPGFVNLNGTKQVNLYADPGTKVRVFVGSSFVSGDVTTGVMQFSGILVDV
jgi:hypothetical protein